jgi:hypothetical protein
MGNPSSNTARQRFVEESRIGIARLGRWSCADSGFAGELGSLGVIEGQTGVRECRRPQDPNVLHGGVVRCESRAGVLSAPYPIASGVRSASWGGGEARPIGKPDHWSTCSRTDVRREVVLARPACAARPCRRRARVLSPAFFTRWQPSRCQRRGTRAVRLRPRFGYTQSPDESTARYLPNGRLMESG